MSEVIVQSKKRGTVAVAAEKKGAINVGTERIVVNPQSGIAYPPKRWNGNKISYRIGDEGWRFGQGEFKRNNPPMPLYTQDFDYDAAEPLLKLKFPNKHGNYDRFTDVNGGQDYVEPYYIEDHFQGMMIVDGGNILGEGNYNLSKGFLDRPTFTYNGIADWSIMSMLEMQMCVMAMGGNLPGYWGSTARAYIQTATLLDSVTSYSYYRHNPQFNGVNIDYNTSCAVWFIKYFDQEN